MIDATNPALSGLEGLSLPSTIPLPQDRRVEPQAKVVKALNTVGLQHHGRCIIQRSQACHVLLRRSGNAKATVHGRISELGFDALDAGPLRQARLLEPFALLWISLAVKYGFSRNIAFELLRCPS